MRGYDSTTKSNLSVFPGRRILPHPQALPQRMHELNLDQMEYTAGVSDGHRACGN